MKCPEDDDPKIVNYDTTYQNGVNQENSIFNSAIETPSEFQNSQLKQVNPITLDPKEVLVSSENREKHSDL